MVNRCLEGEVEEIEILVVDVDHCLVRPGGNVRQEPKGSRAKDVVTAVLATTQVRAIERGSFQIFELDSFLTRFAGLVFMISARVAFCWVVKQRATGRLLDGIDHIDGKVRRHSEAIFV